MMDLKSNNIGHGLISGYEMALKPTSSLVLKSMLMLVHYEFVVKLKSNDIGYELISGGEIGSETELPTCFKHLPPCPDRKFAGNQLIMRDNNRTD